MTDITFWTLTRLLLVLCMSVYNFVLSEESNCQEIEKFNHRCSISCYNITEFKSEYIEKPDECSWALTFKSGVNKKFSLTEDFFHGDYDELTVDKITFLGGCIEKIDDDFLKSVISDENDKSKQFWSLSIIRSDCLLEIEEEIFKQSPFLKFLDLSYNKIYKIDDDAFLGLQMLDILKLNNNKIKSISQKIFSPLSSLKTLDLSTNNIMMIHPFAFKSLTRLEQFKLSRNQIKALAKGIFDQFKSLHTLDLSYNQLEIFSPDLLSDYCRESIKTLYLNNNNLQTLSSKVLDFKNLNPSHLDISLSDNLWICNHQLAWIKSLSVFVREKSIKCHMPPKFKGITIDKISFELLKTSFIENVITTTGSLNPMSIKDEIIGVCVSVVCVLLFLVLLYVGYRNRWCAKPAYWDNNRAEFVRTEVEADEESEVCMIYIEEADKGVMETA